jgi:hypothetical protein
LRGPFFFESQNNNMRKLPRLNRFKAALIHLALSAMVAASTFTVIYSLWFPGELFKAAGGLKLFFLIAGVDVTLGPLLTLVVFVPGKKGLRFDLTVIALLQVAGLAYGVSVLAEARPAYVVFVKDRFELARANYITPQALEKGRAAGYGEIPLTGPRMVGSRLPTDPDEQFRIASEALAGGVDLHGYPQYYRPYEEVREEVLRAAQPLDRLRRLNPERQDALDRVLAELGRKEAEVRYLPFPAGIRDLSVLVDAKDARVLRMVDLRPW